MSMRKREVLAFAGVIAGAAGVVALGFLLKKFIANKKVEKFEEELVSKILENSPITRDKKTTSSKRSRKVVSTKKGSSLVVLKKSNASKLLTSMKKGEAYTQVQLVERSGIPYRSVRRYIDYLHEKGKVKMSGYGKGKKFAMA